MCFTPEISASTFSMGVATRFSTCCALAPGNGTMTLAIVTLICGSSSRGVTNTAKSPSSSAVSPSSGVSSLSRNSRAIRPLKPSFSVTLHALPVGPGRGGRRVPRDGVAGDKSREDLDLVAAHMAEPHLAQAHAAIGPDDVHGPHLAALDDRGTRHEQQVRGPGDEPHLDEHSGCKAL